MHGPNSKGAGVSRTNAPETHNNQHLHFANDGGARKALDRDSLLASLNYNAAEPSIRAVGDILREIGGRP